MKNVPEDWARTTLGEVCERPQYGFTTKAVESGQLKLLRTTDITSGTINWDRVPFCRDEPEDPERYLVAVGDLLVSRAGSIGISHLVRHCERSVFASYLIRFRPLINSQFVSYFTQSPLYWRAISESKVGIAVQNVNASKLKALSFPISPLVEQRAIVAKIESLFSELDQGVAQLETVRAQLGRYRQSVLKAAFEGRLTAAWRDERRREAEAGGAPLPTGDDLLARIHAEREAVYTRRFAEWERAVAEWETAGGKASGSKKPRKPSKPKDSPPPTAEELADLPELPEGWVWRRLDALVVADRPICYGILMPKENVENGVLYVKVRDLRGDRIDVASLNRTSPEIAAQYERASLQAGDVLLAIRGTYGRVAVVPPELEGGNITQDTARLSISPLMNRDFCVWSLRAPDVQHFFKRVARGVAVKGVNIGDVRLCPIAICDLEEQQAIVEEVASKLSVVDEVERTIAAALQQAESLRQSILKKAFEGRLLSDAELAAVRADPAYEPADKLLARIRDDGAQQPTRASPARKRAKRAVPGIPAGERYRQAACAAYAVKRLASRPTFGRVQQMKYLYLVPHVIEQESHIHAERQAAGPLDPAIHKIENLAKMQGWFTVKKSGQRYMYTPGAKIDEACAAAEEVFGPGKDKVDWLLDQFAKFDTERAELVATTFAVWNDSLIDGNEPDEPAIVAGVHGWHAEKATKFSADRIGRCFRWLRDHDLVPTGTGPRTYPVEEPA